MCVRHLSKVRIETVESVLPCRPGVLGPGGDLDQRFGAPGDFAQASAGTSTVTPEILAAIRRNLGLDLPVWRQYLRWLGAALGGDLGTSFRTREPVTQLIGVRVWPTT